jgi:hypothetical protein
MIHISLYPLVCDFAVNLVGIERQPPWEHTTCRAQLDKFLIHNLESKRRITKIESDAALKATIEVTAGAENEATLSGEPWN